MGIKTVASRSLEAPQFPPPPPKNNSGVTVTWGVNSFYPRGEGQSPPIFIDRAPPTVLYLDVDVDHFVHMRLGCHKTCIESTAINGTSRHARRAARKY